MGNSKLVKMLKIRDYKESATADISVKPLLKEHYRRDDRKPLRAWRSGGVPWNAGFWLIVCMDLQQP